MTQDLSTKSPILITEHQSTITTTTSHGCLGNKLSSLSVVGFQSASSMLKSSNPITSSSSSRTVTIPSTSMNESNSLDLVHVPITDQSDKKCSGSSSMNHTLSCGPLTIKHFCSYEEETDPSSSSYYEAPQRYSSGECNDMGDHRENPLVVDDSSSSIEISHDHHEGSHDHNKASHDHVSPHDTHMSSNSEHTEASHATHVSHSSKHNKQKVASLVVCVLNPYLKKGRIANKVEHCTHSLTHLKVFSRVLYFTEGNSERMFADHHIVSLCHCFFSRIKILRSTIL